VHQSYTARSRRGEPVALTRTERRPVFEEIGGKVLHSGTFAAVQDALEPQHARDIACRRVDAQRARNFHAKCGVLFLAAGFAALLLTSAAPATAAVNAWELIHPKALDWRQAAHRRAIAQDLLARLNQLASVVPAQSVGQRKRVLEELAELDQMGTSASPRRRSRLYMSRGYQHYRLLELIDATYADLQCILSATDIRDEMGCWGRAALHFGDESVLDLALSMLRNARLIPKDGHMPVTAQDPAVWYEEYGRGILQHILVPYLAADAELGSGDAVSAERADD